MVTDLQKVYLGVPRWLSRLNVLLLISAEVMISQFVSSSPESGSVLIVRSPAWDSLFPLLSFLSQLVCAFSLKNFFFKINKQT